MDHQNGDLFPHIIERRAKLSPDSIWLEYPRSSTVHSAGFIRITNSALANAVNAVAWLLQKSIPKRHEFEPILYIGPNDARYCIVMYACLKAGYKVLFLSPRNTISIQTKLLQRLDCAAMLIPGPRSAAEDAILAAHPMNYIAQLPTLEKLLETPSDIFTYTKSYKEAQNDLFLVLQSSGTTGDPKPLEYTPEFFARIARDDHLPPPVGHQLMATVMKNSRYICLLPLFHVAGVNLVGLLPLYGEGVPILGPSAAPPTAQTLAAILEHNDATNAILSPATVDALGSDEAALDAVAQKLERIYFGGGTPSKGLGDKVAKRIKLYSLIGSSECGAFTVIGREDEGMRQDLWPYLQFHPSTSPIMERYGPNLFEMIVSKKDTIFSQTEGDELFRTKDLFTPHPCIPDLWKHSGRVDDMIVLSHGEKLTPVAFEESLTMQPLVAGALVFGSGRFELGVLIEPAAPVAAGEEQLMIDRLWPFIEEANKNVPRYATVAKTHILLTPPEKGMLRAGKGTIRRHVTIELYQPKIDALYDSMDIPTPCTGESHADFGVDPATAIKTGLGDIAGLNLGDGKDDFFLQGLDSLGAIRLARHLTHSLGYKVEPRLIYENPSFESLSQALESGSSTVPTIENTIDHYEGLVSQPARHKILITGSTGGIGSFLLDKLLENSQVSHVYCLNRTTKPFNAARYETLHGQAPQESKYSPDRVTFLKSDTSLGPSLGLDNAVLNELLGSVTVVVHNAWPVDFNLSLSSFSPSLDGVVNLIRFCERVRTRPRLVFLSSVSVAKNGLGPIVHEAAIHNPADALPGYGESKLVAERMLAKATRSLDFRASIVRIGQVAGVSDAPYGWNSRDWLPRAVVSSVQLGYIPNSLGSDDHIDWIPIDTLTMALADITLASNLGSDLEYFNVVNPSHTTWKDLFPAISKEFDLTPIEPRDWLEKLRQDTSAEKIEGQSSNPALQLIDFFEARFSINDMPRITFSAQNSQEVSESIGQVGPITSDMLVGWSRHWMKDTAGDKS